MRWMNDFWCGLPCRDVVNVQQDNTLLHKETDPYQRLSMNAARDEAVVQPLRCAWFGRIRVPELRGL